MAQADSNLSTTLADAVPGLARRDFIVGAALAVPAVAAAPMAAMASSGADPIFGVTEKYRAAVKTCAAASSESDRREDILMKKGLGLNPFIFVLDMSEVRRREPIVDYRHDEIDRVIPPDRFG